MKVYTILKNVVQGIKNTLQEAKDYSDARGDYIVEEGTSGIWTYRKWASGIAECWGKYTWSSVNVTSAWGQVYSGSPSPATVSFPSGLFIEAPNCRYSMESNSANYWLATNYATSNILTKDHTQGIQAIRGTSASGISVIVFFDAKGFWKAFENVGGVIAKLLAWLSSSGKVVTA